ncbi:hypothetical protein MKEN_01183300 [Mycena kentingensis (nom. inval.)]|nr:hypothetical protein MKEN_01183300 [Mycena kentingensis (nom. inval.)]
MPVAQKAIQDSFDVLDVVDAGARRAWRTKGYHDNIESTLGHGRAGEIEADPSSQSNFLNMLSRTLRPLVRRSTLAAVRPISSTSSRHSDALFIHRDTPYNNPKIAFKFTPDNLKRANEIISHYPPQYKKAAVIPLLDLGQRQNKGWTSISVMNYVAELLEMPPMRVYEVATFYTMFNREPIGTHFVQVCTTTPCMLMGSTDILNTTLSHLGGITPGETTKDGKFTVIEVECQGACSNAPMMVVGDDFYEDLTPESTKKILDAFAKGEKPKPGPQSTRQTSENSAGLTALTSKPYGPGEHCLPEFQ